MTDYYETPAYRRILADMADELAMPEEVVDKLYRRAVLYFNIHMIRLDRGSTLLSLSSNTGIALQRLSLWDEAGSIIEKHMAEAEYVEISLHRSFVELMQQGEAFRNQFHLGGEVTL